MESISAFFIQYWQELCLLVALIVVLVFGESSRLKSVVVSLMLQIEKLARDEVTLHGPEKLTRVAEAIVNWLPVQLRVVLSTVAGLRGLSLEAFIVKLAQSWFDEALKSDLLDK